MEYLSMVNNSELFLQEGMEGKVAATWRLKGRMKTAGVALVICLNIGTDPPDVIKPNNCARKECWLDPFMHSKEKMLMEIGNALQRQYEKWQTKARYKLCLDPTSDDMRRLCINLRKVAKNDRLLFHYNGHGVPRPTENGEIWVYAKHYTHYMPVSISDLRSWLGDPSIYIFDTSGSGGLIEHFTNKSTSVDACFPRNSSLDGKKSFPNVEYDSNSINDDHCFILASCRRNEILPLNPQYPADLFTCCLTTPVLIAIRWFIIQNPMSMGEINPDIVDAIPGDVTDRKTPRGELNWIFTAITDTIAWDTLPSRDFQRLFRQDLLVASIFRNFLLAKRIMGSLNCDPQSYPRLPETSSHELWQSWDLTIETFLTHFITNKNIPPTLHMPQESKSLSSVFFSDHLSSFEIWLDFGGRNDRPPLHLPILLQVLLSQTHRLRALKLLNRYLHIGHYAVNRALVVGIFPYVIKLLQSPAPDIREVLVSIWACVIEFDPSCTHELVRDKTHDYFMHHISVSDVSSSQICKAIFVLAEMCNLHRESQKACLRQGLHRSCFSLLTQNEIFLTDSIKKWVSLCVFKLCENNADAKRSLLVEGVYSQLLPLLINENANVRASSCLVLGELFGACSAHHNDGFNCSKHADMHCLDPSYDSIAITYQDLRVNAQCFQRKENLLDEGKPISQYFSSATLEGSDLHQIELLLVLQILECFTDGSPLVRMESVVAVSKFVSLSAHMPVMKRIGNFLEIMNIDTTIVGRTNNFIRHDPKDMPILMEDVKSSLREIYNYKIYENFEDKGYGDKITSIAAIYIRVWFSIVEMKSKESHPIVLDCLIDMIKIVTSSSTLDLLLTTRTQKQTTKANFGGDNGDEDCRRNNISSMRHPRSIQFPFHSYVYEWNRNLFLKDDIERFPSEDPLSKEGAMKIHKERREQNVSKAEEVLQFMYRDYDEKPDSYYSNATFNTSTATSSKHTDFVTDFKPIDDAMVHSVSKIEQSTIIHPDCNLSISAMLFHPYYDILIVSDGPNVGIWSLESGTRLMNFDNCYVRVKVGSDNCRGNYVTTNHGDQYYNKCDCNDENFMHNRDTKVENENLYDDNNCVHLNRPSVTSLLWVNATTNSLLTVGSDDGCVRIWRDVDTSNWNEDYGDNDFNCIPSLASSFFALPDVIQSKRGPGLIMCCQQSTGMLSVAGNSSSIRLWDIGREQCVRVFHTGSSTCIGSLSCAADTKTSISEPLVGSDYVDCLSWTRLLAGFGDGSIGLFDERISSNGGRVSTIKAHNSWVVSSYLRKDEPVAITSCVTGGVKFWDIRTMRAFYCIDANYTKIPITSMTVHPCAPLLAMGSHAQFINILTFNGSQVGKITHHDGFLGQRIGPISSLVFHPLKVMLAAGATDSIISVYSAEDTSDFSSFSSSHPHENGSSGSAYMTDS